MAGPLPIADVFSKITLTDPSAVPDSSNLQGKLLVGSRGFAFVGGLSYTQIILGRAEGKGAGLQWGVDLGLSSMVGAAAVTRSYSKPCDCK
jgi:hypothetical protein